MGSSFLSQAAASLTGANTESSEVGKPIVPTSRTASRKLTKGSKGGSKYQHLRTSRLNKKGKSAKSKGLTKRNGSDNLTSQVVKAIGRFLKNTKSLQYFGLAKVGLNQNALLCMEKYLAAESNVMFPATTTNTTVSATVNGSSNSPEKIPATSRNVDKGVPFSACIVLNDLNSDKLSEMSSVLQRLHDISSA